MTPTEAKKWIDEAVSLGMGQKEAMILFDLYAEKYGEVFTPAICSTTLVALRMMQPKPEPELEPPPVEIPRRVVYVGDEAWLPRGTTGEVVKSGGIDREGYYSGKEQVIVQWDGESQTSTQWIDGEVVVELKLTKTEQARLLLERLSAEVWNQGEPKSGIRQPSYIGENGDVYVWPMFVQPHNLVTFPNLGKAELARDTIIRAGLAWREEDE